LIIFTRSDICLPANGPLRSEDVIVPFPIDNSTTGCPLSPALP
jgi:hypothetical protein